MATQSRIKECGVWFDRQFYAGDTGMEIWMSRNSTSLFRDMRWEVICGTRRVLAIRGNPHSWSEKRGMLCFRFSVVCSIFFCDMLEGLREEGHGIDEEAVLLTRENRIHGYEGESTFQDEEAGE